MSKHQHPHYGTVEYVREAAPEGEGRGVIVNTRRGLVELPAVELDPIPPEPPPAHDPGPAAPPETP